MSKSSGTLFYLDLERRDWVATYDGTALTHIEHCCDPWPRFANLRALTKAEVELPYRADEFPGHVEGEYERPYNGFTAPWQQFVVARAHQRAAAASALQQPSTQLAGASSGYAPYKTSLLTGSFKMPLGHSTTSLALAPNVAASIFVAPHPSMTVFNTCLLTSLICLYPILCLYSTLFLTYLNI